MPCDNRTLAATVEEGTAPKPVQENAGANVRRPNSGNEIRRDSRRDGIPHPCFIRVFHRGYCLMETDATELITGREPHPTLPMAGPELEQLMGEEWTAKFYAARKEGILREQLDPLRFGCELDIWKLADARFATFRERFPTGVITELDLGGNRASKSERRAKRLVQNMVRHPGWKAWACQSTETASIQNQQSIIYKYLPPEWKPESGRFKQGAVAKINYSQATGFGDNVLVCPNGSECRFKFYAMKVTNLEGAELNEAWADELITPDWIEALIFRLVTRNGFLGITFTPIEGYSSTVKVHLSGAVTTEEVAAELLPKLDAAGKITGHEKVPRVQENLNVIIEGQKAKAIIVYFHTADNPYGNYDGMKATLDGATADKIKTRAYGVPTKAMMSQFPMFNDLVHIVSLNLFREIQKNGGTWYHFLDPCSGRNWFQQWIFVDVRNRAFIAAESPSHGHDWAYIPGVGDPGPWTVAGNKDDGSAGDGQKEWGWGYTRYLEEIARMEELLSLDLTALSSQVSSAPAKIHIELRWIDARYGNARRTQEECSTTLIEDLHGLGIEFLAAASEKSINSGRGGGDGSLRMINDKLFYDPKRAIDATNEPHLFVVETCPNTIYALKEWTGRDGQHGACKDPIDCLRMFTLSGVEYVDPVAMKPRVHSHFQKAI